MINFLFADVDDNWKSAYAFSVGNLGVWSDARLNWTVPEAYLHGLLEMSVFIIKKELWVNVPKFEICTPSKLVINLVTTNRLEVLHDNNWKDPDGGLVFHVPLLKELYYHRMYYLERDIVWTAVGEVTEADLPRVERCRAEIAALLKPS